MKAVGKLLLAKLLHSKEHLHTDIQLKADRTLYKETPFGPLISAIDYSPINTPKSSFSLPARTQTQTQSLHVVSTVSN